MPGVWPLRPLRGDSVGPLRRGHGGLLMGGRGLLVWEAYLMLTWEAREGHLIFPVVALVATSGCPFLEGQLTHVGGQAMSR